MVDKKDQDYPFIKETIKERPIDKKTVLRRLAMAASCGIVFGICAVVTVMAFVPNIFRQFEKEAKKPETVQLSPPAGSEFARGTDTQTAESVQPEEEEDADSADHLKNVYKTIWDIAEEPRKALVQVTGLTDTEDLLNDSLLTYGDEEGIVFLKNKDAFYILTTSDELEKAEKFKITFSNGVMAEGTLCGADPRTKLVVVRVPVKNVEEEYRDEITAVTLAPQDDRQQTEPVIAIGSPNGDTNSLIYGNITAISGKLTIPDAEYTLITTNMAAGNDGGGVLLDMDGKMIGIILDHEEEKSCVIRAVSVAQLGTLLEKLSNGEPICYAGLIGTTISQIQSESRDIPGGVYIDRVESNSPAMVAGVQSGDILHRINGEEITTMREYSIRLQNMKPGQQAELTVYRKNPSGEYVDVELDVLIKQK